MKELLKRSGDVAIFSWRCSVKVLIQSLRIRGDQDGKIKKARWRKGGIYRSHARFFSGLEGRSLWAVLPCVWERMLPCQRSLGVRVRNSSRDISSCRRTRTGQPCKEGWTDRDEERMSEEIFNQPVCGCGSVQWQFV